MAKVICALLRYTDDEKSLIIEHEKLRQTVRKILFIILFYFIYLALVKYIEIILIKVFILQFFFLNFISQGHA